jgi:hypothetical protein
VRPSEAEDTHTTRGRKVSGLQFPFSGAVESGVFAVHVPRSSGMFQNVLEAFDATQRKGRAGRRLTICFS